MKKQINFLMIVISFCLMICLFSFSSYEAYASVSYVWPVPSSSQTDLSLDFDDWWDGKQHKGIDITGYLGARVVATRAGRVCRVLHGDLPGIYEGGGNVVVIDHYDGIYSHYAHLNSTAVEENQQVEAGAVIGYMGTSGTSTGVHLHFALANNDYGGGGRINNSPSVIQYISGVPVINSALITNRTNEGYDVAVTASGGSGIQKVGFYIWHSGMSVENAFKYYVSTGNGHATFHVSYSHIGAYPSSVQYYTNVEAFDTLGNASAIKRAVIVEDQGNDFYATIMQDSSGGYLQNSGSKIITGLFPKTGAEVKKAVWHFRKQLDGDYIGSYEISSEGNGGCIDVESYGVFDGNGINLLESVGNLAQRFYICLDEQKSYDRHFFNTILGTYSLDVPGSYTSLGGTVQLWTTNFTDAQMFVIKPAKWTIQFDANGGSGAPASKTKNYKTPINIPMSTPTRTGYRFLGWAETSTATVAKYAPGASYSQEGDIRLYAVWERINENVLTLPASMSVIGDEAFLNTNADAIVVPQSVTQIGENAFGNVVIYGVRGSVAEAYANANGLEFVPVNGN